MRHGFRFLIGSVLLTTATVAAAAYPDVPQDHENGRAIEYMQDAKIMEGYPNGTFGPDLTLNRAELLKILVEAKVGKPDPEKYGNCFPDIHYEWFAPYVCFAASQGWVNGYPDRTFKPEKAVNLVEALKMLVSARGYTLETERLLYDGYDPHAWYATYVDTALRQFIISADTIWGYDGDALDKPLTRKRIAEFIYRALLKEGKLVFDVGPSDCDENNLELITLERYIAKQHSDGTAVIEQNFVGKDKDGVACILARKVNPFGGVSRHVWFSLAPMLPNADSDQYFAYGESSPIVNGKAYFRSICDCDGGTIPGVWELDLRAHELREFSEEEARIISPDYRYFVSMNGQEIYVYDRVLDRSTLAKSLAWPSRTLIKQNHGPKDGLSGGVTLGKFVLNGTLLLHEVYDGRPYGKDEVAEYKYSGVETVDLSTLFP